MNTNIQALIETCGLTSNDISDEHGSARETFEWVRMNATRANMPIATTVLESFHGKPLVLGLTRYEDDDHAEISCEIITIGYENQLQAVLAFAFDEGIGKFFKLIEHSV